MKPLPALCAAVLALTLVGCAGGPPKEVLVPVTVYCEVKMPKQPVWATASLPADADIFVKVRALLVERRQRITYEKLLEAAIMGCAVPSPAALER